MIWTEFFAAWGTSGDDDWKALVEKHCAEDVYYADPKCGQLVGRDAIIGMIEEFRRTMPDGAAVARDADGYDGHARAALDFLKGGRPMMTGQYFAELDQQGRITRLVGFPSAPTP